MTSAFDSPQVFQQITVCFPSLKNCPKGVDARGNVQHDTWHTQMRFKLNSPSSREQLEWYGANTTQRLEARCLEPLEVPPSVNVGHVGKSELGDRKCEVQLLQILNTGVSPILNRVLGQKVVLELTFRTEYN